MSAKRKKPTAKPRIRPAANRVTLKRAAAVSATAAVVSAATPRIRPTQTASSVTPKVKATPTPPAVIKPATLTPPSALPAPQTPRPVLPVMIPVSLPDGSMSAEMPVFLEEPSKPAADYSPEYVATGPIDKTTSGSYTPWALAGVLVAMILAVALILGLGHLGSTLPNATPPGLPPALGDAQNVGERVAVEPSVVIAPPAKGHYSSIPPSSGAHYTGPNATATWGAHAGLIAPEVYVDNLARGGVVILINCTPPSIGTPPSCGADQKSIAEFISGAPKEAKFQEVKLVSGTYPLSGHRIVLLAWGYHLYLDAWDDKVAEKFYAAHVDNGPLLQP